MEVLAILLSLIAIGMAYVALQRTGGSGGLKDLKQQMDHLTNKTEDVAKGARETTADILQRLEHMVRGSGAQPSDSGAQPSDKQENAPPPPDGSQK